MNLAQVPAAAGRADPLEILQAQSASRIPELVPVRYGRMAATPFTFYRGGAAIMAADLAATPHSGIITQLCGDAHLSNLGMFFTPERRLVFDLNDFDETHPGPFEWDLKRLAASFVIASENNGYRPDQIRRIARQVARTYRRTLLRSAELSALECWYQRVDTDEVLAYVGTRFDTAGVSRTQKALKKARHRNSLQAWSKLGEVDATGRARIRSDPPLLVPLSELYDEATAAEQSSRLRERFQAYGDSLPPAVRSLLRQYEFREMARKVVGVGSVGTRAWIALLQGNDLADPLFLQMKQAQQSVLAPYVPGHSYDNQGRRVVLGQQLMQASSDIFLGWEAGPGLDGVMRDFYIRQLRDGKGSVVVEALLPKGMRAYAKLCGRVLAQAHARAPERPAIAAFLRDTPDFVDEITEFSLDYADLNRTDHLAMTTAIADGRLPAAVLE